MWSIRDVLKVLARLMRPSTPYPLKRRNSARYEPSCPVMPVKRAFLTKIHQLFFIRVIAYNVIAVDIMKKPISMNANEAKAMLVIIE